jgi:aminoglycoside phosphotransferase (APT) family kinase protein
MGRPNFGELRSKLLERLRAELDDPDLTYAVPPAQLRGGAFSSMFTFELATPPSAWSGRLVLRLVGSSPMQVRTEAGLQEGARSAGLPAPRVLLVEPTPEMLGATFMVMEMLPGRAFLRGVEPMRFARDFPKLVRSWADRFAAVLEMLGQVDGTSVLGVMERRGVPERFARSTRHLDWAEVVLTEERAFDAAVGWLRASEPPPSERSVLVHGDLWPGNVLMRDGMVSGLVDWTMGAVGDPALDVGFARVGFLLMPEPFPPPPPIRQLVHAAGVRIAESIGAQCTAGVGGEERVRYYEALRCAVQLATVVAERRAGTKPGWAHGVPALVGHLEAISGQPVPFT